MAGLRAWRGVIPLHQVRLIDRLVQSAGQMKSPARVRKVFVHALGRPVFLREGTSDAQVLTETFLGRYHLPPPEMPSPLSVLDVGANIGLTAAHFAVLFPRARVLGIELDPDAASLARLNTAPWRTRCEVMTGAAWSRSQVVTFRRVPGDEFAAHVSEASDDSVYVQGYEMRALVDRLGGSVDYLKMDIEGGEVEVLSQNIGWLDAVKVLKVETHGGPASLDALSRRLGDAGFTVRKDLQHWSCLVAFRPGNQ